MKLTNGLVYLQGIERVSPSFVVGVSGEEAPYDDRADDLADRPPCRQEGEQPLLQKMSAVPSIAVDGNERLPDVTAGCSQGIMRRLPEG